MYKKYKRLVYTPSDLLARICKVNPSNAKKSGLICFPRICFRGLIYCDQEQLWLLNVIEDVFYFLGVHIFRLSTECKMFHSKIMHKSIPAPPAPPAPGCAPGIGIFAFCFPWMANSRVCGLLSCQIPRCGDEKEGEISRPSSTLQHFSLIAQSNSSILSILMCDFLFQSTSSFVIALGF